MNKVAKDEIRQPQLVNRSIQEHAWTFHRAATTLSESGECGAPVIVNATFALELYLKALNADLIFPPSVDPKAHLYGIVRDRAREMGHDPSELFEKLPHKLQDHLSTCYSKSPSLTETAASLQEALKLFDKVFERWRYAFEGEARCVKLDFLLELLGFFHWAVAGLARQVTAT